MKYFTYLFEFIHNSINSMNKMGFLLEFKRVGFRNL